MHPQTIENDQPRLSFEKVWAMFQETDKKFQETDKKIQETNQLINKNAQEINDLGRQMGGLHNSFGEMAEHLVAPGIARRFNELGYHFTIEITKRFIIKDQGKTKAEIDILLENGDCIIAVEVKARVQADKENNDINHHIHRLAILRKYWPMEQRKLLGAIAGAIFEPGAKEAALQAGFFILEQSGDTMQMNIPEGFVPKEW